jgi:hypothetical protein
MWIYGVLVVLMDGFGGSLGSFLMMFSWNFEECILLLKSM